MTDLPSYRHFCIKVKHFLARLPAGPRWEATLDQWQSMQGKKRPRGAPQKYEGGKNTGCAAQTAGSWNQGSGVCDRKIPQPGRQVRSEEHTSELQSPCNLVCRLLLEKKNNTTPDQRRAWPRWPAPSRRWPRSVFRRLRCRPRHTTRSDSPAAQSAVATGRRSSYVREP